MAAAATTSGLLDVSRGLMQFTLVSSITSTRAAAFCLGYAFRRGEVPAGMTVASSLSTMQVVPLNRWNDGSLKFASIAGRVGLGANRPLVVSLAPVAVGLVPKPALTLADLKSSGVSATTDCGSFGAVSWSGTDWDSPFQTWISGPEMSSWIYRKPVGTDKHLVAWLEVRLFAGNQVEVLPWIENGYIRVAGPVNKNATYSFTLGGTQRFSAAIDLKHHQRTPLISGTALSYWLGADPQVTPRHDVVYLQSTELVPTYFAKVDAAAGPVTQLAASYVPLQQGNFNYDGDNMPGSGYQEPIGLLPQHDVLYLTANVGQAWGAVMRNGFSAGRYAIHYRDENTHRPLRISQYPSLVIRGGSSFRDNGSSTTGSYTPAVSGNLPPGWDVAHSPSVGFMAYLLSARWYFMEEVQFAATANYLGNSNVLQMRAGSKGLVQTAVQAWQTRSCAWNWRTLVQALCATPDDDLELRSEFVTCVKHNIDDFHGRYVAQPNNPYGWIKPGESSYNNTLRLGAPWQQDFVTAAFGYSVALDLPLPVDYATKLAAFFQWKARSIVSRLGPASGFWYINADPYNMVISPVDWPDYEGGTGPWYPTDAAVYAATYAKKPAWLGSTEGLLAGEIMPGERSFWGNLMPAIAYAVRFGVPGAVAGYQRLISASNWPAMRDNFNVNPVWSVAPGAAQPAWLLGRSVNQWCEIPGTAGAGGAAIDAYSGFAWNDSASEIIIAAAGGHNDSADNRVVSIALVTDAPAWRVRMASSNSVLRDVAYYLDGKPASRHLYSTSHFVPQVNRVMLFGVRFSYGSAFTFNKVDGFNLDTNTWDPPGTWADMPVGQYGAAMVRSTGEVWSSGLQVWSPKTKLWRNPLTQRSSDSVRWPMAHDSLRNQMFTLQWADGEGYSTPGIFATRIPLSGSVQKSVTFRPSAALERFRADAPTYAAMDYDPENDRFLFYCGQGSGAGRIYIIKPADGDIWDMSELVLAAGSVLPRTTSGNGVHNRFRYVSALKGFVLLATAGANLYFIRTA